MILCRNHSFSLKMQNSSHGLCRNHLFSSKMQNFFPELCRNHLFPLKMQNFSHGLCRNHLFSPKMQNPPSTLCRIQPSPPILIQKRIEQRNGSFSGAHRNIFAPPPAAGRFCDKILFQPMAILAERFFVIGRTFL